VSKRILQGKQYTRVEMEKTGSFCVISKKFALGLLRFFWTKARDAQANIKLYFSQN
jgi:hypothetical protein